MRRENPCLCKRTFFLFLLSPFSIYACTSADIVGSKQSSPVGGFTLQQVPHKVIEVVVVVGVVDNDAGPCRVLHILIRLAETWEEKRQTARGPRTMRGVGTSFPCRPACLPLDPTQLIMPRTQIRRQVSALRAEETRCVRREAPGLCPAGGAQWQRSEDPGRKYSRCLRN